MSSSERATKKKFHMCPKDFTIVCIINTVLEPAPPLYAYRWRFVGMQISERRMQNKQLVRSLAAAQRNENYLRFLR